MRVVWFSICVAVHWLDWYNLFIGPYDRPPSSLPKQTVRNWLRKSTSSPAWLSAAYIDPRAILVLAASSHYQIMIMIKAFLSARNLVYFSDLILELRLYCNSNRWWRFASKYVFGTTMVIGGCTPVVGSIVAVELTDWISTWWVVDHCVASGKVGMESVSTRSRPVQMTSSRPWKFLSAHNTKRVSGRTVNLAESIYITKINRKRANTRIFLFE